jgi:hypothetical protein
MTEAQVKRVSAAAGTAMAALNDLANELSMVGMHAEQRATMGYYESIGDLAERVERQALREMPYVSDGSEKR